MKGSAVLDESFIDFLLNAKDYYKEVLKDRKIPLSFFQNPQSHQQEKPAEVDIISEFISKFALQGGYYYCELIEKGSDDVVIQTRREKKQDCERYYFDASSKDVRIFLIMADVAEKSIAATVYLEASYYQKVYQELESGREKLEKLIQSQLNMINFSLRFTEAAHPEMFWLGEAEPDIDLDLNRINLDISV